MTDAPPRMALGTMHFGTRLSATQSREILDAYLDLGGQWIDTANCYAFWGAESGLGGQSETVIGQWLADRGVRDQVRISTKVGAEPNRPHRFPAAGGGLGRGTGHPAIRGGPAGPGGSRSWLERWVGGGGAARACPSERSVSVSAEQWWRASG